MSEKTVSPTARKTALPKYWKKNVSDVAIAISVGGRMIELLSLTVRQSVDTVSFGRRRRAQYKPISGKRRRMLPHFLEEMLSLVRIQSHLSRLQTEQKVSISETIAFQFDLTGFFDICLEWKVDIET